MSRCTNCTYKWKAKDVWKLGFSKNGKECPNCHARQYASFKDGGFLIGLGYLSGIVGVLIIILFPLYINLSDKDEMSL